MRHYISFFLLFIISTVTFSQKQDSLSKPFFNEELIMDINYINLINFPAALSTKWNCIDFDFAYLTTISGKESNISTAIGLGISAQNIKTNAYLIEGPNESPSFQIIPDTLSYDKNKLATTYIELPMEIRFRTPRNYHNKSFKLTIGAKFGYLLKSYHKYVGEDYRVSVNPQTIKFKEYNLPFINNVRYGIYIKAFYGKFGINAYYSLSSYLQPEYEPQIGYFTIGFSTIII